MMGKKMSALSNGTDILITVLLLVGEELTQIYFSLTFYLVNIQTKINSALPAIQVR